MSKKHHSEEQVDQNPEVKEEGIESKLIEEAAKWRDATLRAHAEMENLKKRVAIDMEKTSKYAVGSFAKDLLPVADNLENAIAHAEKEVTSNEYMKNMLQGIQMTLTMLQGALKKHGVERIVSLGEHFDPERHQVIQQVESDQPAGVIVEEMQSGYTIGGDRILREAMVTVSKGK